MRHYNKITPAFAAVTTQMTFRPTKHAEYTKGVNDAVLLFAEESYVIIGASYNGYVVELKAVSQLIDEHGAQVLNYLNATKSQLGLLVHFGHYPKLEYERFILTEDSAEIPATK